MRPRPIAGRLAAALVVSVVLLLSACGRRGSSSGDASKPIDLSGPMTLYAAASQARFDGREDDAEAIEHFGRRKHALEYLGEPVPPVRTIGDILASERTATEPLAAAEERLTSGVSTFDFRWQDRVNEQTIIEDPGRARSHTNPLGEHGIEGTREVRPGVWWVPWTQRGHRADGYVVAPSPPRIAWASGSCHGIMSCTIAMAPTSHSVATPHRPSRDNPCGCIAT